MAGQVTNLERIAYLRTENARLLAELANMRSELSVARIAASDAIAETRQLAIKLFGNGGKP